MEVKPVEIEKNAGILSVILGLIFIVFPMFSSNLVSIIIGLSLIFFGVSEAYMSFVIRHETGYAAIAGTIIGIISIIVGLLFIFYIDALSFMVGLEFYVVGIIMILFGIIALLTKTERFSVFTSLLVLVMGFVLIGLGLFAINQPIYVAIIIGVVLIIEGLTLILGE